jgi:predicted CXXCH cytochrome family protein
VALVGILAMAPTVARANFGPHGPGGTLDTDTCAMCHRVHSSFSPVTFEPRFAPPEFNYLTDGPSALLVGSAGNVTEFCLACHGSGAPGAGTNVIQGVFESSAFVTSSTPNAPLNAGGFGSMPDPYAWNASATVSDTASTSRHDLEMGPVPLWAEGTSLASMNRVGCTSCHDPHPTSNYRMLRGVVNGVTVGGYTGATEETPNAFVFSTETSFPVPGVDPANPNGGFLKGAAGAAQVSAYRPNYTGGSPILNVTATSPTKSMSLWCASCHKGYRQTSALTTVTMNYGMYEANPVTGIEVGPLERHFHPVDVTLETGFGPTRTLPATVAPDQAWVPLEKAQSGTGEFYKDYIGCLTCHRAHGSSTIMTGWAASHLETNALGAWTPVQDSTPGIPPAKEVAGGSPAVGSSALLRTNNRGVCERCHGG